MKKLSRFLGLALMFILLHIVSYCILPFIVFIFGGSFLAVAQHAVYVFFVGCVALPSFLGILFSECFDKNFYSKK